MEQIYCTVEQLIENLNNFSPKAKVSLLNPQTLEKFEISGTNYESQEQVFIKFGDALTIGEPINTNSEA
jgi:hypothetical protein